MGKWSPPTGTADIGADEISEWKLLESTAEKIFPLYGYSELRTPVFEYTEVFSKGLGDQTEVVQKEMYTFEDRGGRSLTLRPEGTAGIIRSLAATDVMNGNEKKVFYYGPMFRGEKPAAGRRRQFHQIGVESVGKVNSTLDAESIAMLMRYLEELGLSNSKLMLSTRGSSEDRETAEKELYKYFSEHISQMCDDCRKRINSNIWRILDCKEERCQKFINSAPDLVSQFSDESRNYFKRVCKELDSIGIKYEYAPKMVRGLDYYEHTVFEIIHEGLGAQDSIAGGGRYHLDLPRMKKPMKGVGFALGMERLIMARKSMKLESDSKQSCDIYLVALGENANNKSFSIAEKLRKNNLSVQSSFENKSMKAQMRAANRNSAKFALIIGDSELENKKYTFKNMKNGDQTELTEEDLIDYFKN